VRDILATVFYSSGMAKSKRWHVSADEQEILEGLQVRPVTNPKDRARCDQLIIEHHYLHDATLVGEQMRYVATYKGRWLALATWSAAAFHIKDRDQFIGWNFEQCRQRRPLLANNSRLLVLPECHSPNLISRFMKLMLGRLSSDWLERWHHPIAMVESFVDPRLYQGTAYKVSGWSHLGRTAGWKRDAADFYIKHDAPKQIWVRELVKKACVKLRRPQLPPEWAVVEAAVAAHCSNTVKEISSLIESLRQQLPEFRRAQALGYPLAGMVSLIVMAMATGVRQGPDDLAQFADTLSQAQLRALGFRRDKRTRRHRTPKKTTFTRVLCQLDAAALEQVLLNWQRRLAGPVQDSLVIIDGKKMRHGGVEMVNATNGKGQYLGGMITEAKSNEIPAARQVLRRLDLAGKIVLTDALHTQVETGQQILFEQGGDFLLTVKANQPTLQATLQNLFKPQAFSPSGHTAHAGAQARAQSGQIGNSLSAVSGSNPQPGGLSRGQISGPVGNPGQTRGQMDSRSGISPEQSDSGAAPGPGDARTQTTLLDYRKSTASLLGHNPAGGPEPGTDA
jgi:predicted transposase YbfD/YdcC